MSDNEGTPGWLGPVVVIGSLLVAVMIAVIRPPTSPDPGFQGSFLWNTVPAILGYVTGLILFPAILVGLAAAGAWVIRRPLSRHTAAKVFFWIWLPTALLMMFGALARGTGQPAHDTAYRFSPDGAPYVVTFPVEPRLERMAVPFGERMYDAIRAETVHGEALLRAEYVSLPDHSVPTDRSSVIATMRQYAEVMGMTPIEFHFDRNELGTVGSFRGAKRLSSDGTDSIWTTFEVHTFIDDAAVMFLYTGGVAETYPPVAAVDFLESIRRTNP